MFSLKHIIPWSLTLICAAHLAAPTASANSLALARLNRNGSLDGALSVDGFWQADLPGTPPCTSPHAFETLSAGGKIYLAGRACGQGFVIRVWPGGAFDTSWAGSGAVRTTKLTVLAMAVDTMGRIVVAGEGPSQFAVARFTHGGQLDTSFGTAGVTYVDFPGAVGVSGQDMGLALQSDGKVVVAGTLALSGGKGAMAAMRLTTTGQLDKTYSADGRVTFDFTSMDSEFALDVAIDSKNRAILAGTASSGSFPSYRNQFAAARLLANGNLDTSFDGDGKVLVDFAGTTHGALATSVTIDASDRPILGGFTSSTRDNFALARLTTSGALDKSFSADGRVTTHFATMESEQAWMVRVQQDGKIVAAGGATSESGAQTMACTRYNTDGSLDATFSDDGKRLPDSPAGHHVAYAVAIDAQGDIWLAGDLEE